MKKPFIIITVLMSLLFSPPAIFAGGENQDLLRKYEIIDEDSFQNTYVTRCEAAKAIMRIVGANDCQSFILRFKQHYYAWPFKDIFVISDADCGYMLAANLYGEDGYAYPYREITLREALAIMVRNLTDEYSDLEQTFQYALDVHLIYTDDLFFSEDYEKKITPDEMELLLNRFLEQKRYVYIVETEYKNSFSKERDEQRSITYLQWQEELVKQRKQLYEEVCVENGYLENGIIYDFGKIFSIEADSKKFRDGEVEYSYIMPYDKNTIDNMLESYIALLESSDFESDSMLTHKERGQFVLIDPFKSQEVILIREVDNIITVAFGLAEYYMQYYTS